MGKLLTLAFAASLVSTSALSAAILQDYEAPGNLDAPFNLPPDFSGSTVGVESLTDTITHITDDGAEGTTASAEHFIPHNAAESPTAAGWQWQVRTLPNSGGSTNVTTNPLFATDGYVGYYLKVDPSVTANILTAPLLEPSTGTGASTGGTLQTVIKDGQWHLYQWNMDDPTQWTNTFNTFYSGGLGDTTLEASVSFDSIALISDNGGNATVRIDQIQFNNAGMIPEPASLSLLALGTLPLLARRRRLA
jgi:hypothetical protein